MGQGREDVPKKVTSGQRTEGSKSVNHENIWAKGSSLRQRPGNVDMPSELMKGGS